jgi:predicted enzyme related to lactoylglutathione lyase
MSLHAPGMPTWVELSTSDVAAAATFYSELFGWTTQVAEEPEAGGYVTCLRDGKSVAGIGPVQQPGQPVAWLSYFGSTDVEATARKVEEAGGKVLAAPFDVLGYGRMAVFTDPSGAAFAAWQAGSNAGLELKGEVGSLSWNELMSRDAPGSKEFYPRVFGWQPRDLDYEQTTYTLFELGDKAAAGMMPMEGDLWPAELPSHWMVYFEVADTDASAARAAELGGMVSVPPTDTVAGRFAVLGDPQGGFFSVIKSDPTFQP